MNLKKKRSLAARTLGVGEGRIVFNIQRLDEIKEAITKQDIRDLFASKAIQIREISGRKKIVKKRRRKGMGHVRKKAIDKKQVYVKVTRKLRTYLKSALKKNQINKIAYYRLRKEIRASNFKEIAQLKDRIKEITP